MAIDFMDVGPKSIKDVQNKVDNVFTKHFGYTPLNERLEDIKREFFELMKWTDVKNLKEEAGDLLCSLIKLHSENEWDVEESIEKTSSVFIKYI